MDGRRSRRGQDSHLSASCPSLSQGCDGQSNNNEPDWLSATLADWADSPAPSGHAHFWGKRHAGLLPLGGSNISRTGQEIAFAD